MEEEDEEEEVRVGTGGGHGSSREEDEGEEAARGGVAHWGEERGGAELLGGGGAGAGAVISSKALCLPEGWSSPLHCIAPPPPPLARGPVTGRRVTITVQWAAVAVQYIWRSMAAVGQPSAGAESGSGAGKRQWAVALT
jgi:hypothetical protein